MTALSPPAMPSPTRPGEPPWNRLGQPPLGGTSTPFVAALVAALSWGLLPILVWPLRWSTLLERERPYYRDLAQWWRRRVAPADAKPLDEVLAALRPRPMLVVLPWVATAFIGGMMVFVAVVSGPERVWGVTYRYHTRTVLESWPAVASLPAYLHELWTWGLTAAYAVHWYAVRSHTRAVGELTRFANRIAKTNGFDPVKVETKRVGLSAVWVIAAVVLCVCHAWWAIPMVLAGAAQRRYAERATPRLQRSLSDQAARAVSAVGGAVDAASSRFCPAPSCGARLPAPARFCSRCGTPAVVAA